MREASALPDIRWGLELAIVVTILTGFIGVLRRRELIQKLLAVDVISTGVVSLFVLVAARTGFTTPILRQSPQASGELMADPFPHAVILTAIVIGLSVQALELVLLRRLARIHPMLRIEDFEAEP
jgi:multicomponent Na+:H+ antiporter subunit C